MNSAIALAKRNFKNTKLAFIIFAILLMVQIAMDVVNTQVFLKDLTSQSSLGIWVGDELFQYSAGWAAMLFIVLFSILQPARNFKKYMNMNVKKTMFNKGCLVSYVIAAGAGAIFNLLCQLLLDRWLLNNGYSGVWNMLDAFGWSAHGIVVAVIQSFAFMLLVATFFHMFSASQYYWLGWVMDGAILVILCVFLPIAPLRAGVVWFFRMILFHPSAIVQILSCLVVSAVFYLVGTVSINRKRI